MKVIRQHVCVPSTSLLRSRRPVTAIWTGLFVNADGSFHDHPKVVNGASDLMVEVFGDKGRHARAAVGAPALPLNVAVEVDAIVEIS